MAMEVATTRTGKRGGKIPLQEQEIVKAFLVLDVEKFVELTQQLRLDVRDIISDRTYHAKIYKRCFVGKDFISWLGLNLSMGRKDAVIFGNLLVLLHVLHHVVDDHNLKDKKLFYRFYIDEEGTSKTTECVRTIMQGAKVFLLMRQAKPPLITDKKYLMKTYRDVFTGIEFVEWLVSSELIESEDEATAFASALFDVGFFSHCLGQHVFHAKQLFYRFTFDFLQGKDDLHKMDIAVQSSKVVSKDGSKSSLLGDVLEGGKKARRDTSHYCMGDLTAFARQRKENTEALMKQVTDPVFRTQLLSPTDIKTVVASMRVADGPAHIRGIPVADRSWFKVKIKNAFIGKEAVEWVENNVNVSDRKEAVALLQKFLTMGLFRHPLRSKNWSPSNFYCWNADEAIEELVLHHHKIVRRTTSAKVNLTDHVKDLALAEDLKLKISPEERELVATTWILATEKKKGDTFSVGLVADIFFERVQEVGSDELKKVFDVSMQKQSNALMGMLAYIVQSVKDPKGWMKNVRKCADKHRKRGVMDPDMFCEVGAILLFTMDKRLGEDFTPEAATAWEKAYNFLSATMVHTYE